MPVSLLFLLFAAIPTPRPVPAADAHAVITWRASGLVTADGELRMLPGWRVRVGPGGRASLAGPEPRAPRPHGAWDDEATVGDLRLAVRATARDAEATYVEARLSRGTSSRAFVLRWDPASGRWADAVAAL